MISTETKVIRLFVHPVVWPDGSCEVCVPPVLIFVEWIFNAMPEEFRTRIIRELGEMAIEEDEEGHYI